MKCYNDNTLIIIYNLSKIYQVRQGEREGEEKTMKKRMLATTLAAAMLGTLVSGCSISTTSTPEGTAVAGSEATTADKAEAKKEAEAMKDREVITLWFWGAEPYAQEAMQKILADQYNASQDKYALAIEFRPSVDTDMSTALAAN